MKFLNNRSAGSPPRSRSAFSIALLLAALLGSSLQGMAQQLTGTLSGTVYDQAGSAIPNAQVVLKNEASGDERTATSDGSGHFTITAVQPANYTIMISAGGFSSWQENDVVMNQGDSRDVPNIKLRVGGNSTQVEVIGGGDAVVPTDTAEISTSLNEKMINDFPLAGRDAGELLKIMPGMALNNGSKQGSGFNDQVVGSNSGPIGSYSSNGTQPNGTMAFMLDGANLVDPGNFGVQIANVNPDMVANIKVLMSNYGAEYAKGPVIFQAFSKSGGQQFHGEGYLYTHNAELNSVDAYTKSQGGSNAAQSYYYFGGNVGGPVLLPFVGFNKDRKKLFFWGGYEYMKQQPAGSIINYNVPNAAQLTGDFSNAGIDAYAIQAWPKFYQNLSQNLPTGGTATSFPTADMDPNAKGILNLYPKTNHTPTAANAWTNYAYTNTSPQNRWEATGKADYAFSDNTKLTGSYSYQKEDDLAPISIWWAEPSTLPYPTAGASKTVTYVILTNFTHVFNATTTNEAVFTWSHFVNPYTLANPKAVDRTANNFNVQGLFGHTTSQIPNISPDYCCSGQLGSINYYPMTPGSFGGVKQVPAFYDNFTKLFGAHTLKFGFYWDKTSNHQNNNSPDNGQFNIETYGQTSTNNLVADTMLGRIQSYQQQNQDIPQNTAFHQVAAYVQDSWRAGKQLTLNYGLRFDHIGQWYGDGGTQPGFQVFSVANYLSAPNADNAGLQWHAKNSSIPMSGFKTPPFYLAPRIGFAFDVFGTGRTVFRGGFAVYRYQATSETASAQSGPFGSFEYTTPNAFTGYANNTSFTPPAGTVQNGANNDVRGMQPGDDRAPFTNDWNATISQALPHRSVLEVSYVGNRSGNEYQDGSNSNILNLNNISRGGLYQKDPLTGQYNSPSPLPCQTAANLNVNEPLDCLNNTYPTYTVNDFRPYHNYQNIYLLTHNSWQRYDSLQASYQKQSGPVTFSLNYTFGKVLGIRDGASNNGGGNGVAVDPFVIRNNYGPLAYDHTNIINATYNWSLPKPIHGDGFGMHLLGEAVNGWQLSGYTAFQSGAPIQPNQGGNINANYAGGLTVPTVLHPNLPDNSILLPNGLRANSVNPSVWFGTNAYNVLVPALTCNPLKGLKGGQRFNPACFTTPAFGQQGPSVMPYMRQPNYWDSDLGIYKSFRVREGQHVDIRASATNWLNHPLSQFGLAGNSDIQLNFQQTTNATCSGCTNADGTPIQVISQSSTNTNVNTTGTPAFKTGSRFVTLAAKYYF